MTSDTTFISIRKTFAGAGVLLTGSTGFLAKAVAEKLLRDLPDIGQIFLLIAYTIQNFVDLWMFGADHFQVVIYFRLVLGY